MRSVLVVVLALTAGSTLTAQRASVVPQEFTAFVHANLVDVRGGTIVADATLVVRDGKIVSAGPGGAPAGAKVYDLGGRYVVPGLIDTHTHLASLRAARTALQSGVTTVRSAGVSSYVDVGLRELVKKGAVVGPDIVAAGYHVRPVLAEEAFVDHPELSDLMGGGVTTAAAARRVIAANAAHHVDAIKVLATERAGTADTDPREQVYTKEMLREVVQEAAAHGLPVLAHAHGAEGALAAVKAGVRSIEHGTYLTDEALQLMKEKGTYFVPTYATVVDLVEPGGDYDNRDLHLRGEHMLPRLKEAVVRAHRLGVKVVTGADTSYGPNSVTRISQEVAAFVEFGFTPAEALRSATTLAAECLRVEKTTGALEPGLDADLVVVERNPLEQIGTLKDVLFVMSNGRVGLNRLTFGKTAATAIR